MPFESGTIVTVGPRIASGVLSRPSTRPLENRRSCRPLCFRMTLLTDDKATMRLSPPTLLLFLITVILAALAIVTKMSVLPVPRYLPHQEYWLAITAYVMLAIGVIFRGL